MFSEKILIINNGIGGGGIERSSVGLANHFAAMGYNISIVALYRSNHFYVLDKDICFVEPKFSRDSMNRALYILKILKFLRKNIIKIKPDTILAFSEWTNPYVVIASLGIKIPLYLSDRMSPLAKLPFISEKLKRLLYKRATGIIAQTQIAKEILQVRTKSKNIKVIYNPVNKIEKMDCESKNKIISVGRLSKEKGHKYLIEAFAKISNKTWELEIVGEGNERQSLENLCNKLNLGNRVNFLGNVKDFSKQLSEAKIFVLPSLSEGFPNALIEAMSLPIACISSNCIAGPGEIIKDGVNGSLVEPGNVEELTSRINLLISNSELRESLAHEAYKIGEALSFEKIANQYLDFILDYK